jgi:hypothetical protein
VQLCRLVASGWRPVADLPDIATSVLSNRGAVGNQFRDYARANSALARQICTTKVRCSGAGLAGPQRAKWWLRPFRRIANTRWVATQQHWTLCEPAASPAPGSSPFRPARASPAWRYSAPPCPREGGPERALGPRGDAVRARDQSGGGAGGNDRNQKFGPKPKEIRVLAGRNP